MTEVAARRRKRLRIVLIVLAALMLITATVLRSNWLHNRLPDPKIRTYSLGEEVTDGDVSTITTDAELYAGTDINKVLPGYTMDDLLGTELHDLTMDEALLLVVRLRIENTGEEQQDVRIPLYVQSRVACNGMALELLSDVNTDINVGTILMLQGNETITINLPFLFFATQFKDRDWKRILDAPFDLIFKTYPVKHMVRLIDANES
jgi:hypothetical protein